MSDIRKLGSAERLRSEIGADLYDRLRSARHMCVPLGDGAYFAAFRFCDVRDTKKTDERVLLRCSRDGIELYTDSAAVSDAMRGSDGADDPFICLADFFLALTRDDLDEHEKLERDINALEDGLITSKKPVDGASSRIVALRGGLLRMKRYYEQLGEVVEALLDNENGAIPPDAHKRLSIASRRLARLTASVSHLRECIVQVREAYQAQIDIEQNNIMKIFTVITAVFLPLTLIVGWYGMNFQIPEYGWSGGYIYVSVLSAVVAAICVWYFKRKKWF